MRRYIFSERKNRQLKEIYMTDALTGLYNRTGCEKVLYEFITEQKKQGKKSILVFADIDRMKIINDRYGHLKGDFAIKATADAFKKFSPDSWMFGRYGGDEFIAGGTWPDLVKLENSIRKLSEDMTEDSIRITLISCFMQV